MKAGNLMLWTPSCCIPYEMRTSATKLCAPCCPINTCLRSFLVALLCLAVYNAFVFCGSNLLASAALSLICCILDTYHVLFVVVLFCRPCPSDPRVALVWVSVPFVILLNEILGLLVQVWVCLLQHALCHNVSRRITVIFAFLLELL